MVTVMRFSVSVPVLSEQIVVTEPSVSTAGSLRISALPLDHALRAERQGDGHHGGQPFGHGRHRQADGGQEHLGEGLAAPDAEGKDDSADHQRADGQPLAQLGHAPLQGRLFLAHRLQSVAMLPSSVCMPVSVTNTRPRP